MNKHTVTTYNAFGFTERIFAAGVQDLNMEFETATGNLNWRKDLSGSRNLVEVFNFDTQNRLVNGQVTAPVSLQQYFINYNSNGTIDEKSDAGVYSEYDPLHPDAVKIIESLAGNISHLPQQLEFNPFNKLSWITEGNYILNINYGPDQQRCKTELSTIINGSVQTTKYFLSNYEKIIDGGDVYEINYITAPSGLCAMYVTTNGAGKMYYVYSDHLGSILKLTDHNGTTYEQNFDAWGRYRNPDTWDYSGIPVNPAWMHRGFTSHEHLEEFVLINMNGRLYDPVVGAMLSPDNYVSDASSAIAFNRYAYCLNNPFKYTDPSGDFIFTALSLIIPGAQVFLPLAIAMDVGGVLNTVSHAGKINSVVDLGAAYGIGAVAGAAAYYTGGAAFAAAGGTAVGAGGFFAGSIGGGVGYTFGTTFSIVGNGAYFRDAPPSANDLAIGFGVSLLTAGTLQGINAKLNGRDFWTGDLSRSTITPIQTLPTRPISTENTSNSLKLSTENNSYTLNTFKEYSAQPLDGRSIQIDPQRPGISSYHPSLSSKTDLYHSFPKELDQAIVNQGAWSQRVSDYVRYNNVGYLFEAPGTINGVSGMYQIGINGQGIVFHRFFMPY